MGTTAATGSPFRVMTVGLPLCARVINAAKWARASLTLILLSASFTPDSVPRFVYTWSHRPARWFRSGAAERPRLPQAGVADVGPLALGVASAVTAAAVGDAGLPGHRVRLFQPAPDDHGPVGQYQRRARPGLRLALGAGGGALLGRTHPGDDGGDEAEQPAPPPRPNAAHSVGHDGGGQSARHLEQQRGVQDVGPLQIRGVAEYVDACPRPAGVQQDALAPHGAGQPGQQVRPDLGPRVVDVDDAAARPV